MARILLLLTRTHWRDFRLYDIQGPALLEAGHEVIYVSGCSQTLTEHAFNWVTLSNQERWLARRTGSLNLYIRIFKLKPDVVQLCSLEQLPLGLALKARRVCRVIYDCREDMASALYERRKTFPVWIRRGIFRSVRALELFVGRQFDGIITADPGVYDLFDSTANQRKLICFNSALLKQFPASYPNLIDRKYDIAVLGSMSSLRSGTHHVLDALRLLHLEGISARLLLIGQPEGEMSKALKERIDKYGLKRYVHCTGWVTHSKVPALLAQARIGIVPLLDYPKFHRNIACKAFEYMAVGMPTIASDLPPQRLFLSDETSFFFPPGDVNALATAIRTLLMDCVRSIQMGKLAREAVEERWNGEREQEKLRQFYFKIMYLPPQIGKKPIYV